MCFSRNLVSGRYMVFAPNPSKFITSDVAASYRHGAVISAHKWLKNAFCIHSMTQCMHNQIYSRLSFVRHRDLKVKTFDLVTFGRKDLLIWHRELRLSQVRYRWFVPNYSCPATDMLYNTTNGRAHNDFTTCCTTNSPPTDKNLPHPTSWHVEMLGSGIAMWQICCTTSCRIVVSLSVDWVDGVVQQLYIIPRHRYTTYRSLSFTIAHAQRSVVETGLYSFAV